jgi:hypothetical protein
MESWCRHRTALQLATHKSSFWLLVYADEGMLQGTAYHLQKRAITMQREKVKLVTSLCGRRHSLPSSETMQRESENSIV